MLLGKKWKDIVARMTGSPKIDGGNFTTSATLSTHHSAKKTDFS
jgi:hypothetical protein